jgi:branched-chain amino acid transport system ATP-binding protein
MARLIRRCRDELGLAVVWIEHAVAILLRAVERVVVMHQGRTLADGAPGAVARGVPRRAVRTRRSPAVSASLGVTGLAAGYGGFPVLSGFDLEVRPDRLTVIVGPNGAGKSTLLRALAGLLPRGGTVRLGDRVLPPLDAAAAVQAGLVLVAEGRHLFPRMTVWENLELGGWSLPAGERAARAEQALALFPRLVERRRQLAGSMSGGEQQMVAVARALVARPRLLMLDEPSLGLAPRLVDEVFAIVRRIREAGVTVLLIEQNVAKALAIGDDAHVLERGRLVASGPAPELARSDLIRAAYLGGA